MDALLLEVTGSLDTLPGGADLDQDTVTGDTGLLVETDDLAGLGLGSLLVEGEAGVDLGGDTARDNLEDLLTEFDEKSVHGVLGLLLELAALGLAKGDSSVDQLLVSGELSSGEADG